MAGLNVDRQDGSAAPADEAGTLDTHLVAASGQPRKIFQLIGPSANAANFEIVRVRYGLHDGHTLQIMAERPDGTMNVAGCEELSGLLSAILDVEDPIPGEYNLEISSPGIDRPLTRPKDFERWAGFEAKLELGEAIDGRKRFRGLLQGFEDGEVLIEHEVEGFAERQVIGLPFRQISEAKLVMSDDLITESLKRRDRDEPAPSDGE
ncbi:ribosome maturation factor RimP [Parvibaculum sp.]|uniref:ribosome maturation factor RimP n=1 Tax=Parvibaculum sp. TaxID=2024848 RepID=UPI0025D2AC54|nr:ribosome maturation factor RimP [Parvibaculum sp.]